MRTEVSLILGEGLLFELQGREGQILSTGIEAGTVLLDPRKVAMTKDPGIGVIGLQSTKQGDKRLLLGRSASVRFLALGIETSLVTNTNRVGVVATGMGSNHILGAALVEFAILGDVVMVADGLVTSSLVTGFEVFGREVASDASG